MRKKALKAWLRELRIPGRVKIEDRLRFGEEFSVWGCLLEAYRVEKGKGRWVEEEAFKLKESEPMEVRLIPWQVFRWADMSLCPYWYFGTVSRDMESIYYASQRYETLKEFADKLEVAKLVGRYEKPGKKRYVWEPPRQYGDGYVPPTYGGFSRP